MGEFKRGDVVSATSRISLNGESIPNGTIGEVTKSAPSFKSYYVRFKNRRRSVLVKASKLRASRADPTAVTMPASFSRGDRVRLKSSVRCRGKSFPPGTKGEVTKPAPSFDSSYVCLDGEDKSCLVENSKLERI